jgi:hypothetical protein
MVRSLSFISSRAARTLALCVACSCAGAPGERVATEALVSAVTPVEASAVLETGAAQETTAVPFAATAEMAAGDVRPERSSPIQALQQMLTAQALLVSLLLTPLSRDGAEGAVARADAPPALRSPVH